MGKLHGNNFNIKIPAPPSYLDVVGSYCTVLCTRGETACCLAQQCVHLYSMNQPGYICLLITTTK